MARNLNLSSQLDIFLRQKPALGKDVYIAQGAIVLGDVTLGDGASVWYHAVLRGDINRIVVGHHSNIQDGAVLHLAEELPCLVGNYVTVGHGAIVHACAVGDECLIGMGAVVLDGAELGAQCLVGAARAGDAAHENSRRLPRSRRSRQGRARPDSGRTRRPEKLGGQICCQCRLLFGAQNRRRPPAVTRPRRVTEDPDWMSRSR